MADSSHVSMAELRNPLYKQAMALFRELPKYLQRQIEEDEEEHEVGSEG